MNKFISCILIAFISINTNHQLIGQCTALETFDDPSQYTQVGTLVEINQSQVQFTNNCPDASQRRIYRALDQSLLDSDCWSVHFLFHPISTGILNGEPYTGHLIFSFTETDMEPLSDCPDIPCTGYPPSTQHALSISYSTTNPPDGNIHFKIIENKDGTRNDSELSIYNELQRDIYLSFEKDCNNVCLSLFQDPEFNEAIPGTETICLRLDDHRSFNFLQHGNTAIGFFDRQLNAYIDDFCFDINECHVEQDTLAMTACAGDGYEFELNGITYNESNPEGQQSFTNVNGCDSIIQVSIDYQAVEELDIPDTISLCAIDQFLSELNTTYQINSETGPLSEIVESGNYTISINADPCFMEKRISVIDSSISLEIPNIIKRGSAINGIFKPIFLGSEASYELSIFDAWGNLIFSRFNEPWDGRFNGSNVAQGVYLYMLEISGDCPTRKLGTLTVL